MSTLHLFIEAMGWVVVALICFGLLCEAKSRIASRRERYNGVFKRLHELECEVEKLRSDVSITRVRCADLESKRRAKTK